MDINDQFAFAVKVLANFYMNRQVAIVMNLYVDKDEKKFNIFILKRNNKD